MPDLLKHPAVDSPFAKKVGAEPIPGYVLLGPLGRGGFGEVWKCEAPGGLHKAIKFVAGDTDSIDSDGRQLRQEFEAFQQIKLIRHPFLLSLERVELVAGELVMVMELADKQLGNRFDECRGRDLPGIPRAELLGYLEEAAEALDVIGTDYGLQHLDVKPANLFLTAGHVKVGDYGLVCKLDPAAEGKQTRGLTPRYVAPEVIQGVIHTRSDQYSLALVYFELLTGRFPYTAKTPEQLMMKHALAEPDLSALPAGDAPIVRRALAKQPGDRFPSCREFVSALLAVSATGVGSGSVTAPAPSPVAAGRFAASDPASRTFSISPTPTESGGKLGLPRLVTAGRSGPVVNTPMPVYTPTEPPPREVADIRPMGTVRLARIQSVLPVAWLRGNDAPDPARPADHFVRSLLKSVDAPEPNDEAAPRAIEKSPDGVWSCRFLTSMDPRIAQVKLDLVWEEGGVTMDTRTPGRVVFHKPPPAPPPARGLFGKVKEPPPPDLKNGFRVLVELPDTQGKTGEVVVTGRVVGSVPHDFARGAERFIVKLISEIRRQLKDVEDRRKHPRIDADYPLTLFPMHSDGSVDAPLAGRCKNVSAGGLALLTSAKPGTRYGYVAFDGVAGTTGLAVLVKFLRNDWEGDEVLVTGQFRLDLGGDGGRP
jgi:serine/threonine protein kinase